MKKSSKNGFVGLISLFLMIAALMGLLPTSPKDLTPSATHNTAITQEQVQQDARTTRSGREAIRPSTSPTPRNPYELLEVPNELIAQRPHTVDFDELQEAYVERVVDGDTLIVRFNGNRDRLRMLGINAPESSSNPDEDRQTSEGDIVSALVKDLLTGRNVRLEFDRGMRDQYDRLLAYVWIDEDTMINENLVYSGLVKVVKFEPNKAYYEHFRELNREAKDDDLGFYSGTWE